MNSNSKSPGGLSAFPGTPARTSLSAQELADVSPMEMLDALPDLSAAADKLLDFVIPSDISEASIASLMTQVQTKDSRVEPRLTRLGKTLQAQRDVYGGASYINIGETFNRLLGGKIGIADDRIATATWRPEPLLQKANLAKLALRVLGLPAHSQKSIFVEELAQAFPLPFVQKFLPVGSMTPGSSSLSVETLELALEIRTQEAIMILDRHTGQPNFDSDVLLTQIFFKNAKTLRGWGIEGLMVSEEIRGCIVQRVENLRSAFKDTAAMSPGNQKWGVELLKTIFSWNSFAHHIIGWTHQRLAEIRDQTASYGGVKAICASLHEEMQSGRLVTDFTDDNSPQIEIDYDTPSEAVSEHQSLQKNTSQRENFSMAQFR